MCARRPTCAPNGESWEEWLQHSRIELNAFTSAELIDWLDRKMVEHGAGKLIPPDDILRRFGERVRNRAEGDVETAISSRLDEVVVAIAQQQAEAVATIKAEEAEAKKPLLTEIDRLSAPLIAELNRVRAPLLEQIASITAPLHARIADVQETHRQRSETVRSEAKAINREAEVERMIQKMLPDARRLRVAISEVFTNDPRRFWKSVVTEIADGTDVGEVDIDLGDGHSPNLTPDDADGEALP